MSEGGRRPPAGDVRGGQATGFRVLTERGLRTRATLVAAARRVFDSVPCANVKLTDITADAGVSAGTFYTYFDSKEEIFREVASEVLRELSRAARPDPATAGHDRVADIASATRGYFAACLRSAVIVRSMEQLSVSDEPIAAARSAVVRGGIASAERWIQRLQRDGICDPALDARTTAVALHTMNVRVAYDHLLHLEPPVDLEPLVEAVTQVWARTVGLLPRPPESNRVKRKRGRNAKIGP